MTTPPPPSPVNPPVEVIPCPRPRPLPEPVIYQSNNEISACAPVNDSAPIFNNLAALEVDIVLANEK